MFYDDKNAISFLKEGEDEEFQKTLKRMQDFSCNMFSYNQDNNVDVNSAIKKLDSYYTETMNFENNEKVTPPPESMKRLDNLYGNIMESKKDKNIEVEKNREYLGDPSEVKNIRKKNTFSSKLGANSQSLNNKEFLKSLNKNKKEEKNYELQSFATEPENFDQSCYEYPMMDTPSVKNSFAYNEDNYQPPLVYTQVFQPQSNVFIPGIPVYNIPRNNQIKTNDNFQNYQINTKIYPNVSYDAALPYNINTNVNRKYN